MVKLSQLKADFAPKWFPFTLDVELEIRPAQNPDFVEAARVAFKPHMRRYKVLTDTEKADIMKEPASKYLLTDWKGIEDMEYSSANALELFNDPELPHFYAFVLEKAGDWQQHLQLDLEDEKGN